MYSSRIWLSVTFLAGLVIAVAVFYPGLSGPFLLDDKQNFVDILNATPVTDMSSLMNFVFTNGSGALGRPVSMLSFAVTAWLAGVDPWAFKFHNLLLHLASAFVLSLLTRRVLMEMIPDLKVKVVGIVSMLSAVLWLIHPLQVSTVLYAVQRMAMLSAFFTLLALYFYVAGKQLHGRSPGKARFYLWILFPLAGLLSIFSKENGALIPFYVFLIDAVVFRCRFFFRPVSTKTTVFAWCYGVFPMLCVIGYFAFRWSDFSVYAGRDFNQSERLMTQLHVVAMYIKQILLPRLADMSLYHDFEITRAMDASTWMLLVGLVTILFICFQLRRKEPVLVFGIGWFLVSHLMESTFIGLELVFEHRNYLASAGVIFIVVYYLVRLLSGNGKMLALISGALVLMLSTLTAIRAKEWSDSGLMIEVAVIEQPNSLRANTEYANQLIERGDLSGAIAVLDHAIEIAPRDFGPLIHQLVLKCQTEADIDAEFSRLRESAVSNPLTAYSLSGLESLVNVFAKGVCEQLSLGDLLALVNVMLANPSNHLNAEYHSFLLRFRAYLNFGLGNYEAGFNSSLEAYEVLESPIVFRELASMLITFGFLDDARITIDEFNRMNSESFGIYDRDVQELEEELAARIGEVRLRQQEAVESADGIQDDTSATNNQEAE